MSTADPKKHLAIRCNECQALLDVFVEAVHEVVMLNEKHLLAVIQGDSDPHRFELLIHAANEKKLNAKYAYVQHRETHGCSPQKQDEIDRD